LVSRQKPKLFRLESNQSSPRLAARDGMEQETLRVSIATAIEIKRWGDVRSIPQARLPRFKKVLYRIFERFFFAFFGLFANAAFAKETSSALEKI
jgi:hypothetical protein